MEQSGIKSTGRGLVRNDDSVAQVGFEVKPGRRRVFTAEYKRDILRQVDACTEPGEVGALLRREGLYSSHLTKWRQDRKAGELAGLSSNKRGPKGQRAKMVSAREVERLERENKRLRHELQKAKTIITFQKKLSEMLGIATMPPESES
jgi:transposase-like protein